MLSKLTKLLSIVCSLILVFYLLFPWWAAWVVKSNLPANIQLLELDPKYPSVDKLFVNRLKIKVNQQLIQVDNLSFDYQLHFVQMEKVAITVLSQQLAPEPTDSNIRDLSENQKIKQASTNTNANGRLKSILLQFDSERFDEFKLSPVYELRQIDVKEVTLVSSKQQIKINDAVYTHSSGEIFTVKLSLLQIRDLVKDKLFEYPNLFTELRVDPPNKFLIARIDSQAEKLAEMEYSNKESIISLDGELSFNSIEPIIKAIVPSTGVMPVDEMHIRVTENLATGIIDGLLQGKIMIDPSLLDIEDLSLLQFETKKISMPLQAKLSVDKKSDKPIANLDIDGRVDKNTNLFFEQGKGIVSDLKWGFTTSVDVGELNKNNLFDSLSKLSISKLAILNSSLSLNSSKIYLEEITQEQNKTEKKLDEQLTLSDLSLQLTTPKLVFDLNDISSTKWEMDGKLSIGRLIANYKSTNKMLAGSIVEQVDQKGNQENISDSLSLESMASSTFKVSQGQSLKTSGELDFSDYSFRRGKNSSSGNAKLAWNSIDTSNSQGEIALTLDALENKVLEKKFGDLSLQVYGELEKNQLIGNSKFLVNGDTLLPTKFEFNMDSNKLALSLPKKQISNMVTNQFLRLISDSKKMPLQVVSGDVENTGEVQWADKLHLSNQLSINEMLLKFGENKAQGINMTHQLSSIEPLIFNSSLSIEKVEFSSGLAIEEISADMTSESKPNHQVVELNNLKGKLLEGALTAESINMEDGLLQPSLIKLHDLSLTELIFLMDVSGLYAEGNLNIDVPISMPSDSLVIKNGKFSAKGEGIVKYTASEASSDDENIALKALRNFHYTAFDGGFSYNNKGEYTIRLHLVGSNPDLYDGYPIDFVLNLNGVLSGVFRSLFLTGNFEEAIMEQVKADHLNSEQTNQQDDKNM